MEKVLSYVNTYSFGNLSSYELDELFKDGSVIGKLLECDVSKRLGHIWCGKQQNYYDSVDKDGNKWEHRCLTKRGAYLIPSNQQGANREYNEIDFLEKLFNIVGYVLQDIRRHPHIDVYMVNSWEAYYLFGKRVGLDKFRKVLTLIEEIGPQRYKELLNEKLIEKKLPKMFSCH